MKVVNSTEKYSNIDTNVLNVVTNNSSVVNTNTLNTETITTNTLQVNGDNIVRTLEVVNGKIIIGGDFTNKMYVYDPVDDTFTVPIDFVFNRSVESLLTIGGDVYVGGGFFADDGSGSGIVKYRPRNDGSIISSVLIEGSLHENGRVTGSKTLNFVGDKVNLHWNGGHWFV